MLKNVRHCNIIFVVIDALRAKNLSCYGYARTTTPAIDALAQTGVLFDNAYSCTNHTDPSLTSMFTGKFPLSHGIVHHGTDITPEELDRFYALNPITLPQLLKQEGYHTVGISWLHRWHKRGFDLYGDSLQNLGLGKKNGQPPLPARGLLKPAIRSAFHRLPFGLQNGVISLMRRFGISRSTRNAAAMTTAAIKAIDRLKEDKFFLHLHYTDAHYPYRNVPEKYKQMFKTNTKGRKKKDILLDIPDDRWRRLCEKTNLKEIEFAGEIESSYNAGIRYIDDELKRLTIYLKENNIFNDTYFIITGDHGDDMIRDNVYVGHFGLFENVIHVPLIISGGEMPKGLRVNGLVQHTDIVPTVLELLGSKADSYNFDGGSLMPAIRHNVTNCDYVVVQDAVNYGRWAVRWNNLKYICSLNEPTFRIAVRSNEELYNLQVDPEEKENIATKYPDIAAKGKQKLVQWLRSIESAKQKDGAVAAGTNSVRPQISEEETQMIEKRLRELGYIE